MKLNELQQYYFFFPFPNALFTLSESEGEEGIVGVISGLLWQASFSVSEPGQEKMVFGMVDTPQGPSSSDTPCRLVC